MTYSRSGTLVGAIAAMVMVGVLEFPGQRGLAQEEPGRICQGELAEALDAIRLNHAPGSRWGILVQSLEGDRTLYSREAQQYFLPASNVKLLTTAAALTHLGPDYRVRTSVYRTENGLQIVGRGDPTLTHEDLGELAQQVAATGLTSVGELWLDASYFPGEAINPRWQWQDVQVGYGAPANSAIVDRNEIPFTLHPQAVGEPLRVEWEREEDGAPGRWWLDNRSRTVAAGESEWLRLGRGFGDPIITIEGDLVAGSDPAPVSVAQVYPNQAFLEQFRRQLEAQGLPVGSRRITEVPQLMKAGEIAAVDSPSLGSLVERTNRVSDNLYAEVLLRWLGVTASSELLSEEDSSGRTPSAAERGLRVLSQVLGQLGVDEELFEANDGSGLSRVNWVSPQALVQTLQGMARSPHGNLYRASLPVAGESGTLRNRLGDSPVAIQAKTGTIAGVSALSGYLEHPEYGTLTFSIMVNQSTRSASDQRGAIDDMVRLLTQVRSCSG
ncbi:MAG: D-alanyl-D-alanine carboxypeptidase/D-alanyl-D-alanine-endopeptidase [Phormidium sp. BM_Day4_Bin.17]|nr:D-alanyl-D-alanine carboxypeptidase/D-alanyl-D-alanine-endopeptidase [Phormidium sp. BM_Day4_Bin.17]UCJ12223.1 MAG: D-alanyl-D-alanine carboxypeptidase/D-alanyl-D-alanine-endopeptidase [Phormidium sp. PBR-2020]